MIELWDLLIDKKKPKSGYSASIIKLLENRASAYLALKARREARTAKYNNSSTYNQTRDYALYIETARYYYKYYSGCKPKANPPQDTANYYYGEKTKVTKHRIYEKAKYNELINNAFADFKKSKGRSPASDKEMLEYLFSLSPEYAFDDTEREIWRNIYAFYSDVSGQFTAVKRSDKRTLHKENSFKGLCAFLLQNPEYTSRDRYFISRFIEYCSQKGLDFKRSTVDGLLRYDAKPECFSESDLTAIGLLTLKQRNDFFKALKTVNTTRQKK